MSCLHHDPSSHKRHHTPLCYRFFWAIVRCNSVTLGLVRGVRVRPRQTRTRHSLRPVLWSPFLSMSSRPRSKKCSTGEYATVRVPKFGCWIFLPHCLEHGLLCLSRTELAKTRLSPVAHDDVPVGWPPRCGSKLGKAITPLRTCSFIVWPVRLYLKSGLVTKYSS